MNTHQQQRGFVLVVGLLMLLVITIVGVTAMSGTTSNERMTANNQFQTLSFQAAESAIHDVFNPTAVTPSINAYTATTPPGSLAASTNYDVNVSGGNNVAVTADSDIQFCGEEQSVGFQYCNGLDPCNLDRVYDVEGTGTVATLGTQERHLRRGAQFITGIGIKFDTTVCQQVQ